MRAAARRAMLKVATRLRSTTRRNASSGCGPLLPSVRTAIPPPAVLQTKWSAPSSSQAADSAASVPSKSVTSQGWKLPPSSLATSAPLEAGRSRIDTCAPSRTSISAVAFAMPDAPPTTTAAFPAIFMEFPSSALRLAGARSDDDRRQRGARPGSQDRVDDRDEIVGVEQRAAQEAPLHPDRDQLRAQLRIPSGHEAGLRLARTAAAVAHDQAREPDVRVLGAPRLDQLVERRLAHDVRAEPGPRRRERSAHRGEIQGAAGGGGEMRDCGRRHQRGAD